MITIVEKSVKNYVEWSSQSAKRMILVDIMWVDIIRIRGCGYVDIDHIGHLGHLANLGHLGHLANLGHLGHLEHLKWAPWEPWAPWAP